MINLSSVDSTTVMRLTQNLIEHSSSAINLQRLVAYRYLMLAGMVIGVGVAFFSAFTLPFTPLFVVILIFAGLNLITWLRLRWLNRFVSEQELFMHLLSDVLVLAALLYLTGGSTNPFVSLFLLPLTLAAASLPGRYTWAIAIVAMMCYSLLMVWHVPLPRQPGNNFNIHVIGMWFGFVLSAILISYFAVKMSATLRERDQALARARENALRDERLVALGTLAAGAAHELGTPLATMAVLTKDLESECASTPSLAEPFRVLRSQIGRCKDILSRLAISAGQTRAESGSDQALDLYLKEIVEKWNKARPAVGLQLRWEGTQPAPRIIADQTLTQAITNILNNAADASQREVEVTGRWNERELCLEVCDRGAGISAAAAAHAGEPFFTTKPPGQGLGLGLFLAQSTIKRIGGNVKLFNRQQGGACARIILPLSDLTKTV